MQPDCATALRLSLLRRPPFGGETNSTEKRMFEFKLENSSGRILDRIKNLSENKN